MIETRHLQYFIAVAEERHFRRAAERLGLSQPPLSRKIRELEELLGVILLERTSRSVRLTTAGRRYYEDARAVLKGLEHAGKVARAIAEGKLGRIAIAFSETAASSGVLRNALQVFRDEFPNVEISVEEATAEEQALALRQGQIDVSLGYKLPPLESGDIESHDIFDERLLVALPERDPIAWEKEIDTAELSKRDMLFLPRSAAPGFHSMVLVPLRAAGVEPRRIREVKRLRSVFTLIACEVGFGVAPWSTTRSRVDGVIFRELSGFDVQIKTHVFSRRDAQNPLVDRFVDACAEAGNRYRRKQLAELRSGDD